MDILDSAGCYNPVIMLIPRYPDERNTTPRVLIIDRAYPGAYLEDPDPRSDQRIWDALWKAGVLVIISKI